MGLASRHHSADHLNWWSTSTYAIFDVRLNRTPRESAASGSYRCRYTHPFSTSRGQQSLTQHEWQGQRVATPPRALSWHRSWLLSHVHSYPIMPEYSPDSGLIFLHCCIYSHNLLPLSYWIKRSKYDQTA